MNETVKEYLVEIGRKGGKNSRRTLTSQQANAMAVTRWKRWHQLNLPLNPVRPELKRKIRDYNRIDQELETLWQDNDKPRGKAWEKLATPLSAEQARVEAALAPLLLEWAEKNGCGAVGWTGYWYTAKGWTYKKIAEHVGLKASSLTVRGLIELGRSKQSEKQIRKQILGMSDAEFADYMKDFCTLTDEGKNLKEHIMRLRAAFVARAKGQGQTGGSGVRNTLRGGQR